MALAQPEDRETEDRPIYAQVNGLRFHIRDVGRSDLPPVLMLHGIMGHSREWDVLINELTVSHRCFVVDQRGHGLTDWADDYDVAMLADDVLGVIDHLEIAPATVIGHSMGALAAMLAAAQRPDVIERLVVIDVGPDSIRPELTAELVPFLRMLAGSTYDSVDDAYQTWEGNPLAQPALLRHYVKHALTQRPDGQFAWRFDGEGLVRFFDSVDARQLWEAVDRIDVPVLLVRGEHSPVLSPETANEMAHRFGRAELVTITNGAHDLGVEQPAAVAGAVIQFLSPS